MSISNPEQIMLFAHTKDSKKKKKKEKKVIGNFATATISPRLQITWKHSNLGLKFAVLKHSHLSGNFSFWAFSHVSFNLQEYVWFFFLQYMGDKTHKKLHDAIGKVTNWPNLMQQLQQTPFLYSLQVCIEAVGNWHKMDCKITVKQQITMLPKCESNWKWMNKRNKGKEGQSYFSAEFLFKIIWVISFG